MKTWFYIISAVYLLSPIDLLPERGLGRFGIIDDVLVIAALYWYLVRRPALRKGGEDKNGDKAGPGKEDAAGGSAGEPAGAEDEQDPYKILGVPENASAAEIRQAYLKLANKYHPDKVDHLGDEFKALAHERFKKILAAYERLSPKKD